MSIFKKPDYRDSIARYSFDSWGQDFWTTRTWLGRVIAAPVSVWIFLAVLVLLLIGDVGKKKS